MEADKKIDKHERVWIAIFFGYNGSCFNGMQHQKDENVTTVENILFPLLFKAGFLPTDNYTQLQRKQKYSRAARTDSGVHACINGFSCNFQIHTKFYTEDHILDRQKLHLAFKETFQELNGKVVYHCFQKVTPRFEMRLLIHWRRYSYICPKRYFVDEHEKQTDEQLLLKLNDCCKQFIGTHNFHNYSRGLNAKDAEAQRYILNFEAQSLKRQGQEEFIQFYITGQSFVYHQIRKMVGCIAFVFVNKYPAEFIGNTFFRNEFHLPVMPPYGLYLKEISFEGYNKRKQIPQKIDFQVDFIKSSREKIESEIIDFVCQTDPTKWEEFIIALRQGKTVMPCQKQEENIKKGHADC